MDAFATIADLAQRFRPLTPAEQEKAQALLEDAAAFIQAEFVRCDKEIDTNDELLAVNLKVVSCAMVKRILGNGIEADVSQTSRTAGSFNEQFTFNNPTSDLYMRDQERRLLGIPKRAMRIKFVMPEIGCDHAR